MRVLFLGTPQFACPSLDALVRAGHQVVGVVTRPDKPAGRGGRVTPPPVKALAENLGLLVLQPQRMNAAETVATLRALEPDLLVVAAFGAILKTPLLTLAPHGAVNVHGSLLPAFRGVAPVQWTLIQGRRTAGITIMQMDEGIDTGPTLARQAVDIRPMETSGELLGRLALVGADLLVDTLPGLESGTIAPVPQPVEGMSYAPRLEKEHGYLDFDRPAPRVHDQFRGVTPAPGARVILGNEPVLVGALRPVPDVSGAPYTILEVASRHLRIAAKEGAVDLLQVRPAGRKDMDGASFARGRRLAPGDSLERPPVVPELDLAAPAAR